MKVIYKLKNKLADIENNITMIVENGYGKTDDSRLHVTVLQ